MNEQYNIAIVAKEAIGNWYKENPKDKIQKQIKEELNKSKRDIFLTLMGFSTDSWGKIKYEVDHCNGRSGESAIGDYLRKTQKPIVDEWLASLDIKDISLNKQELASLKSELKHEVLKSLKRKVSQYAEELAEAEFQKFKKESMDAIKLMNTMVIGVNDANK
jgi:hypothetical protein